MFCLKDRSLYYKLIAIDPEFGQNLSNAYEDFIADFRGGEEILDDDMEVEFECGGGINMICLVSSLAVEEIPDFYPNGWNEFPKIVPPSEKRMLLEVTNTMYGGKTVSNFDAYFKNGEWWSRDGQIIQLKDAVCVRFILWEKVEKGIF